MNMATLIAVGDKDGVKHRCDARCYDASGEICTCVCGGRNHGVGKVKAMNNIYDQYEDLLREAEILFDGPFQWVDCPVQARQLAMPL